MFRVNDPRSEPRVLHELTQNKMAEDGESDIAIRFVDENDNREISAKAVSAKRKLKQNRPSWLVSKHCYDVDSSEAKSSSEKDEKVSAREEEAVTETESANEIQEYVESSYSDDSSADEAKRRKSAGKPSLNLRLRVRPSPNQAKRRRRNQINGTRVFRKKRWSHSLFPGERRLFRNAFDLFTLFLPFARHVLHGV